MVWIDKTRLRAELGISPSTAKNYRLRGDWIEGVHYQGLGDRPCVRSSSGRSPGKILYHLENCLHWLQTRHQPDLHENFCLNYQESLIAAGGPKT